MIPENSLPEGDPKLICKHCPYSLRDEWRARGSILRMELRRHDLTHRELQLAELILDKTYGWQRADVVFPQLRFFTDFTGIDAPNVVKVLKTLHARRVIRIITVKGQPTYSINADPESWKAMPRVSKKVMQATNDLMREWNGLEPLHLEQDAQPNFKDGHSTQVLLPEIVNLTISKDMDESTSEFPNLF